MNPRDNASASPRPFGGSFFAAGFWTKNPGIKKTAPKRSGHRRLQKRDLPHSDAIQFFLAPGIFSSLAHASFEP
jgi:hypothetical protein